MSEYVDVVITSTWNLIIQRNIEIFLKQNKTLMTEMVVTT